MCRNCQGRWRLLRGTGFSTGISTTASGLWGLERSLRTPIAPVSWALESPASTCTTYQISKLHVGGAGNDHILINDQYNINFPLVLPKVTNKQCQCFRCPFPAINQPNKNAFNGTVMAFKCYLTFSKQLSPVEQKPCKKFLMKMSLLLIMTLFFES